MKKDVLLRPYELVVLVDTDATDDEQKNLFRKNKEIIEQGGGQFHHVDTWGRRNLANPANGRKRAIYFHSTFEGNPATIKELERVMKINDRVLRYMHTRLDEKVSLAQHLENFKNSLTDVQNREKDREQKFAKKRASMSSAGKYEKYDKYEK